MTTTTTAPLTGLRVLDLATLFAGPLAATMLGDFGAEVIKVEHPRKPDPSRGHGPSKDGVGPLVEAARPQQAHDHPRPLRPGGRATLLRLAATADVIIENFRPGTLEKWDLGWDGAVRGQPPPGPRPASPASASSARTPTAPASAPSPRR